ncbi:MAG: hypothetical protein HC905_01780 [Bacteroidales bacterium]|nr:hypothetical protein [Bacteroidales bacterium]
MDDHTTIFESLIEKTADYSKVSYQMMKLTALDKVSETVSSLVPKIVVFALASSFLLFFNLGLAFWIGLMMGSTFHGFFIVAAFYAFAGIVFRVFMYNWLKNVIGNHIIKTVLK